MGQLTQVYINSSQFALATAVFTDQGLTTLAPDGFYSMQGIVREQVSGVLGKSFVCEECAPLCDEDKIIYILAQQGEYDYTAYVGDGIGAIRVHVNTLGGAMGFNVEYNGTTYNDIYTRNLGLLESTSSGGVTYIGDSSTFNTGGASIPNYNYAGGDWVNEGTVVTINPFAGSNLTNSTYHGGGVITIPKISNTINEINLKVRAPFTNSSATFRVDCVGLLPSFNSSQAPEASSADVCDAAATGLFYCSAVNGSVAVGGQTMEFVAVGDLVFNDPYALTPANNGWYGIDTGSMQITNGVITNLSDCAE